MLVEPGGAKRLLVENLALRQQLIVVSRRHKKSPALTIFDRKILGVSFFFIPLKRLTKLGIVVKPSTILKFHKALVKKKYRVLYGSSGRKKPGPKGFDQNLVNLVIDIKKKMVIRNILTKVGYTIL